jgi:hypothetical protein
MDFYGFLFREEEAFIFAKKAVFSSELELNNLMQKIPLSERPNSKEFQLFV